MGDIVLIAPVEGDLQYIGRVEKLFPDPATGKMKVISRWYYRPHEAKGGRRTVSLIGQDRSSGTGHQVCHWFNEGMVVYMPFNGNAAFGLHKKESHTERVVGEMYWNMFAVKWSH